MATATLCLEILRKLLKKTQNILCNKTKKTKTKQELTSSNFSVADFASASSFSFLKNKEKIITKNHYNVTSIIKLLKKYMKSNRVAS